MCVRHERCDSGVGGLYREYCNWEVTRSGPCSRGEFEGLLRESGVEVCGEVALGLILGKDLRELRGWKDFGCVLG